MAKKRGWDIGLLGEALAVIAALFDKRTPLFAKLLGFGVLAYLFSPFDFDWIPFIGWIDDAMIVPLGLWLASRFIPDDVMDHARARFSRNKAGAETRPAPRNVTPKGGDKPKLSAKSGS